MAAENALFRAPVGRASEDIALQIESAIFDGKFLPGDSLPSERELQSQFGTGRGVVREAISALKQKGLIEIRKGPRGGAYVRQVDVANISESLALFLKSKSITPIEIAEFRESVDQTIAQLAMVRATEDQKIRFVQSIEQLENLTDSLVLDVHEIGEIDKKLNIMFAEMAGNTIFHWVMQALQQGFSSYDDKLYGDTEYCRKTVQLWRVTAECIIHKEPFKLQASVSQHYFMLRECMTRLSESSE